METISLFQKKLFFGICSIVTVAVIFRIIYSIDFTAQSDYIKIEHVPISDNETRTPPNFDIYDLCRFAYPIPKKGVKCTVTNTAFGYYVVNEEFSTNEVTTFSAYSQIDPASSPNLVFIRSQHSEVGRTIFDLQSQCDKNGTMGFLIPRRPTFYPYLDVARKLSIPRAIRNIQECGYEVYFRISCNDLVVLGEGGIIAKSNLTSRLVFKTHDTGFFNCFSGFRELV
ncbi:hypothetical protein [Carp edema virus]|nr:hypothetical protein [Carp edema virus]